MKIQPLSQVSRILARSLIIAALFGCHCLMASVLDDFNDNTLTDWQKFDFSSGIGQLSEAGGPLTIGLAVPPGRQFFVAATKTSKTFTRQDRRTIEFRIDLVNANQDNSYVILAWVPLTWPAARTARMPA